MERVLRGVAESVAGGASGARDRSTDMGHSEALLGTLDRRLAKEGAEEEAVLRSLKTEKLLEDAAAVEARNADRVDCRADETAGWRREDEQEVR